MNEVSYVLRLIHPGSRKEILLDKNERPVTFPDLTSAIDVAKAYHQWHPELAYEVKKYLGSASFAWEIVLYGRHSVALETEARISPDGRLTTNPPLTNEERRANQDFETRLRTIGIRIS